MSTPYEELHNRFKKIAAELAEFANQISALAGVANVLDAIEKGTVTPIDTVQQKTSKEKPAPPAQQQAPSLNGANPAVVKEAEEALRKLASPEIGQRDKALEILQKVCPPGQASVKNIPAERAEEALNLARAAAENLG